MPTIPRSLRLNYALFLGGESLSCVDNAGDATGEDGWPPSTVQPCAIFAAFRGDRASCGRLHAFEFELREDNA
jgi:hypothetical protein